MDESEWTRFPSQSKGPTSSLLPLPYGPPRWHGRWVNDDPPRQSDFLGEPSLRPDQVRGCARCNHEHGPGILVLHENRVCGTRERWGFHRVEVESSTPSVDSSTGNTRSTVDPGTGGRLSRGNFVVSIQFWGRSPYTPRVGRVGVPNPRKGFNEITRSRDYLLRHKSPFTFQSEIGRRNILQNEFTVE